MIKAIFKAIEDAELILQNEYDELSDSILEACLKKLNSCIENGEWINHTQDSAIGFEFDIKKLFEDKVIECQDLVDEYHFSEESHKNLSHDIAKESNLWYPKAKYLESFLENKGIKRIYVDILHARIYFLIFIHKPE